MKNTKKIFLLMAATSFILLSCSDRETTNPSSNSIANTSSSTPSSTPSVTKYTVKFSTDGGSTISDVSVNENGTVDRPANPTKEGFVFIDWYTDSALTTVAVFPYTVKADTTFYAKWEGSLQHFSKARDKTVNSEGFTYSDNLNVTTSYNNGTLSGPTAKRTGETQYSTTGEVGYYQHFAASGALLYDGQSHSTRKGTQLQTIKQNEDGLVTSVKNETVAADFKYDPRPLPRPYSNTRMRTSKLLVPSMERATRSRRRPMPQP